MEMCITKVHNSNNKLLMWQRRILFMCHCISLFPLFLSLGMIYLDLFRIEQKHSLTYLPLGLLVIICWHMLRNSHLLFFCKVYNNTFDACKLYLLHNRVFLLMTMYSILLKKLYCVWWSRDWNFFKRLGILYIF